MLVEFILMLHFNGKCVPSSQITNQTLKNDIFLHKKYTSVVKSKGKASKIKLTSFRRTASVSVGYKMVTKLLLSPNSERGENGQLVLNTVKMSKYIHI